jgi:hypothetical protein
MFFYFLMPSPLGLGYGFFISLLYFATSVSDSDPINLAFLESDPYWDPDPGGRK